VTLPTDVRLDRPWDGLLVRRIETLCGSYQSPSAHFALTATCQGRPLALQPCGAAPEAARADARGFWAVLVLQEWLDAATDGRLRIEFHWHGRPVGQQDLIVSPIAADVARRHPIPTKRYPVSLPASAREATTLVFPGLGAVGGTSLCQLFRAEGHRRGWGIPVHHEADHAESWARYDVRAQAPIRWVDGHHCYDAGKRLGVPWERVTLLREPKRRLVSLFNYNALVHPREFPFRSFSAFLESGSARRYSQAAGLLRLAGVRAVDRMSDAELANAAQEELGRSYEFAGLTERFEESIFYLARLAGLDSVPMWVSTLSAPRREGLDAVPPRLEPALREAVVADEALYRAVRDRFERTIRNVDFGSSLRDYQQDAAAASPLHDADKTVECLRWRQFLVETSTAVTSTAALRRGAAA